MLALMGDPHDQIDELAAVVDALPPAVRAVLVVGDLKVWPEAEVQPRFRWRRMARDVLTIDGNHDHHPTLRGLTAPTVIRPGLTFLPRGTVLTLPGLEGPLKVGVLGGADSVIDAAWRRPGIDWWPDLERVTDADVDRLVANVRVAGPLDVMVTHTPPAWVTTAMTGRPPHPSAVLVERAWEAVSRPPLVCGHMHQAWSDEAARVEVLPRLGVAFR